MITAFYRETGVVEAASDGSATTLWVKPVGNATVTWKVDGVAVAHGTHFTPPASGTVTAIVQDTTSDVRDEQARAQWMTRTLTWIR